LRLQALFLPDDTDEGSRPLRSAFPFLREAARQPSGTGVTLREPRKLAKSFQNKMEKWNQEKHPKTGRRRQRNPDV